MLLLERGHLQSSRWINDARRKTTHDCHHQSGTRSTGSTWTIMSTCSMATRSFSLPLHTTRLCSLGSSPFLRQLDTLRNPVDSSDSSARARSLSLQPPSPSPLPRTHYADGRQPDGAKIISLLFKKQENSSGIYSVAAVAAAAAAAAAAAGRQGRGSESERRSIDRRRSSTDQSSTSSNKNPKIGPTLKTTEAESPQLI